MRPKTPKASPEQKQLEAMQLERERQLRVENARQTTRNLSDNLAMRRRLRGVMSLLTKGFAGHSK